MFKTRYTNGDSRFRPADVLLSGTRSGFESATSGFPAGPLRRIFDKLRGDETYSFIVRIHNDHNSPLNALSRIDGSKASSSAAVFGAIFA